MKITIIGAPVTYKKDYYILIQKIGDLIQNVIFHKGSFYQSYVELKIAKNRKWSPELLKKAYLLVLDQAQATVDLLESGNDPSKLIRDNEEGAMVSDVLERAKGLPN